jgi:hypothetical protein
MLDIDQKLDLVTIDAHKLHRKLELAGLPIPQGACYNSRNEEHNARCLPNTRTELLDDIGGLLARRATGCIGIPRQDSTAVGGGLSDVSQHAGGPFFYSHSGGLLARRAAGRVSILRQDSTAVGGGHRDVSQHAKGPFLLCHCGGLLA